MKRAKDFRQIARHSLAGKWFLAIVAGMIAVLLGAATGGFQFTLNYDDLGTALGLNFAGQSVFVRPDVHNLHFGIGIFVLLILGVVAVILILVSIIYSIISSIVKVGYSKFNLNLVDGSEHGLGNLFEYFSHWKTTFVSQLLRALYVFLWSLLFIIPGIVASYSYFMTDYILAENPDMTAGEAIKKSKEMMYGNKTRLFCLMFSFIGWDILVCMFTFGIGYLWLTPYKQASFAAFYREISQCEKVIMTEFADDTIIGENS